MDLDRPVTPPPMSAGKIAAYAIIGPLVLGCLLFLPAGSIAWMPGWVFLGVSFLALALSTALVKRFNPILFRARSRFQPGTRGWDLRLVSVVLVAAAAIMPVAAFDAGRLRWSSLPVAAVVSGYVLYLAGFAVMAWAQVVNEFFEPGVRIQTERHHHVIDSGPYAVVRHPGYSAAILLFIGMALALGSLPALFPAALASAALTLRTLWEDRMLQSELPGYRDYTGRVPSRLLPGVW